MRAESCFELRVRWIGAAHSCASWARFGLYFPSFRRCCGKEKAECLAQGFVWVSTESACLSSFQQRSAPSLWCGLSHRTYCKRCWFTEILKLLLETELPHAVWLAHGSLRDWAKKGGWGWNCFEMNPVYVQRSGMLRDGHGNGLCLQACRRIWQFCVAHWQPRRIFICI